MTRNWRTAPAVSYCRLSEKAGPLSERALLKEMMGVLGAEIWEVDDLRNVVDSYLSLGILQRVPGDSRLIELSNEGRNAAVQLDG